MRELANKILTRTDLGYLTKSVTNGFKHIWNHHLVDLNMPVGCPAYRRAGSPSARVCGNPRSL